MDNKTSGGELWCMEVIKGAYQTLLIEGKARIVLPEEKLEWIEPSRPVVEPWCTKENIRWDGTTGRIWVNRPGSPHIEIATDFRRLIKAMEKEKPQPQKWAEIPLNTGIMAKLEVKSSLTGLPVQEKSLKYLNFSTPFGIRRYLRIPAELG